MATGPATGPPIQVPHDVLELLQSLFSACNAEVAGTLSRVPMTHEDALDQLLISNLNRIGPKAASQSGWIINIETHFLGGGHHDRAWDSMGFWRTWEIADIGVLVILRRGKTVLWSKVGVLQSKRLFPIGTNYDEDAERAHFHWGFGRLLESYEPLAGRREFAFSQLSRYQSLDVTSEQAERIGEYEARNRMPIHYLLYNPVEIPWKVDSVSSSIDLLLPDNRVGCRVVRSQQMLSLAADGVTVPTYANIDTLTPPHSVAPFSAGWRLEDFVVSLLIGCVEGRVIGDASLDGTMENLFYRRTGPIAAAFAVNIELPE